jgi:MFS superfamily sulfate permease-like transporter
VGGMITERIALSGKLAVAYVGREDRRTLFLLTKTSMKIWDAGNQNFIETVRSTCRERGFQVHETNMDRFHLQVLGESQKRTQVRTVLSS